MVIIGRRSGGEVEDSKASGENLSLVMATERSRNSLHNFSLPSFNWGEQRYLCCVKVNDDRRTPNRRSSLEPSRRRRSYFEPESFVRPSSPDFRRNGSVCGSDGGIEAVKKEIMLDFQTQVDRMKSEVLSEGSEEIEPPQARKAAAEARPWNLRTRRALCKDPNANGAGCGRIPRVDERKPNFSPAKRSDFEGGENGGNGGEKRQRAKLRVPLTKQEIEDDFVAMTGIRPPRKPKKRPRQIQKQIDASTNDFRFTIQFESSRSSAGNLRSLQSPVIGKAHCLKTSEMIFSFMQRFLPGLWLSEIRPSMYKVNENADFAKS